MVARDAACQVISELPVCLTTLFILVSLSTEQDNKTQSDLAKNKLCLLALVYRCHNMSWGHSFLKDREDAKFGPGK